VLDIVPRTLAAWIPVRHASSDSAARNAGSGGWLVAGIQQVQ
jgi:hypothetical protein